jgi:hypothetical protein
MRIGTLVVALSIFGCAHKKADPAAELHLTGSLTLAVAPLPSVSDDEPFAAAYQEPGRVSLKPMAEVREKFAADHKLRSIMVDITDASSSAHRNEGLALVVGEGDLEKLRTALAPADLILVTFKFELTQRLWRSMTGDFTYRVYDLRGGKLVAMDKLALKMDTSSDIAVTETDTQVQDKLITSLGGRVRKQLDQLLGPPPAAPESPTQPPPAPSPN